MHNSEPTFKRQNDILLCYRKAECECPLYLFVLTLCSAVVTSTHLCHWVLPFWQPSPSLHLPEATPSRRPWGCPLSQGTAPSTKCRLPGRSIQDFTHKPLYSPLQFSILSTIFKFLVPTLLRWTFQAYSGSLLCFE